MNSRHSSAILYSIVGVVGGLILVLGVTVLFVIYQGDTLTFNSLLQAQLANPALWIIDLIPILLGVSLGLAGSREDQLRQTRMQMDRLVRRRDAQLQRLTDEMEGKEQSHQEIETIISRGKQEWEATFDSVQDMIIITDLNALGMELTTDYHERTRLFSAKSFVGNLFAMSTPWLLALANLERFKGTGNEADGMRYVSMIIAALLIPLSFWWFFSLSEPGFVKAAKHEKTPFWAAMTRTVRNRNFVRLTLTIFTLAMGFNFVQFARLLHSDLLCVQRRQGCRCLPARDQRHRLGHYRTAGRVPPQLDQSETRQAEYLS